ncbi:MAG: hypothetical protein ACI9J2_002661 [Saprospiraceae bacterium]|jgi:hypothetical protein
MDKQTEIELQAAAFRGLVKHLQKRTDLQNIDLMNLAGFCRNCLSKWVKTASDQQQAGLDYDQALELIYGMPYDQWKQQHQKSASDAQVTAFKSGAEQHADTTEL